MKARKRVGIPCGFVFLAALLLPSVLAGQTFHGDIQGTVTDSTGGALPGADVTATNSATRLGRTVVTDNGGNYFIPELPLGDYPVKPNLSGFGPQTAAAPRQCREVTALALETPGIGDSIQRNEVRLRQSVASSGKCESRIEGDRWPLSQHFRDVRTCWV